MRRAVLLVMGFALTILQVGGQGLGQGMSYHDTVSVYLATSPGGHLFGHGRFFRFIHDSLFIWSNNRSWPALPDESSYTARYALTPGETESISKILRSPDTLKNAINPCMMDGLILAVTYPSAGQKHEAFILNGYNHRVFIFAEIINSHVPEEYRIRYDKEDLIRETNACFESLNSVSPGRYRIRIRLSGFTEGAKFYLANIDGGFSIDLNFDQWRKASLIDSIIWTDISDLKGLFSLQAASYQIRAIPKTFLIDKNGIVREIFGGYDDSRLLAIDKRVGELINP